MKRTPLYRRTALQRAPIRRRPTNAHKVPPKIRAACEARSGGRCEAHVNNRCHDVGRHLHHRLPRSAGGEHTMENLLHVCRACHEYIHAHPGHSYEQGWLLRRQ